METTNHFYLLNSFQAENSDFDDIGMFVTGGLPAAVADNCLKRGPYLPDRLQFVVESVVLTDAVVVAEDVITPAQTKISFIKS